MTSLDFTEGNSFDLEKLNLQGSDKENYEKYIEFQKDINFYLNDHSDEMEYDVTSVLNNVHWGQLKLFCSELSVMINHMEDDIKDILYIGAANGSHIYVLAEFFEDITFHLYDSQKFDKRLLEKKHSWVGVY